MYRTANCIHRNFWHGVIRLVPAWSVQSSGNCVPWVYFRDYRVIGEMVWLIIYIGWFCDQSSDVFSVGCLIAQLWTRSPLFIKCSPGPDYVKEMLYQYKAVLDIYPSSGYVYSLRASDPDSSIENLTYREDLDGYPLSPEVKSFLSGDCEIQVRMIVSMFTTNHCWRVLTKCRVKLQTLISKLW